MYEQNTNERFFFKYSRTNKRKSFHYFFTNKGTSVRSVRGQTISCDFVDLYLAKQKLHRQSIQKLLMKIYLTEEYCDFS